MNLFIWYVVAAVVLYGIFEMTSVFDSVSDTLTGGVTAKSMGDAGGDDRGAWKPVRGNFISESMNKEMIACIFFPLMGLLIYLYVQNHMNGGKAEKEGRPAITVPKRSNTLPDKRKGPKSSGRSSPAPLS